MKVCLVLFGKLKILWHIEGSGKQFHVRFYRTIQCRSAIQDITRWGQWKKWRGRSSQEGWDKLHIKNLPLLRRSDEYAKTSLHCVSTHKNQVLLKKPLKCVWCSLDTYFVCRVFLDNNNKLITLHLKKMQGNGIGNQWFFKWHDENHFGLIKTTEPKPWN